MNRFHWTPRLLALIAWTGTVSSPAPGRADDAFPPAPPTSALRQLPLDCLSSGALARLDRGGDLIQWPDRSPAGANSRKRSSDPMLLAGLDPRAGGNVRLGDDPAALPASSRAQAEPHIIRDPHQPDTLLATFQEGRYTDGGAVDCGYAISHDGGLSWSRSLIEALTQVSGGSFYRATDPVAGVDHQGNLYLNTLAALDPSFDTGALLLHRSTNGGASFDPPREVFRSPSTSQFPDKNWMAVNTFPQSPSAGRVVVTWTMFSLPNGPYPIARVYSDDGGATWSTLKYVTPASYYCQGSQPVFLPDGTLAVVYWNFGSTLTSGEAIEVTTSSDGGVNFATRRLVTPVTRYDAPAVRDGAFLPAATTDRTNGTLFVAYQALYLGRPRIMFTKSGDKGVTWTSPKPASDNPANAAVFNPAIGVSPDGQTVTIVFHDGRMNPGQTNFTDLFLAQSFDGGNTWQPNLRLTPISTDVRLAPLTASGYMLGDYLGIAPPDGQDVPAVPIWVDTRTGDPDPFVARVGVAPQITFASWRAARFSLSQIADPAIGGPGANPDGDRFENLLEYALGLQPWIEDVVDFDLGLAHADTNATLTTTYERLSGASDLSYAWSASSNLKNWNQLIPTSEAVVTNANRMTETVTSSFSATNANQFYHLTVELK